MTASPLQPPDRDATLSVVIVDDLSIARARLRRLLSAEPDIRIVAECDNGASTLKSILDLQPDLVFLDIQMPELNGLEVLTKLSATVLPNFVFVTAYDHYALDAFAMDAMDYLLKPFDAERLQVTLRRARERILAPAHQRELLAAIRELTATQREIRAAVATLPHGAPAAERPVYIERVSVKTDGRIVFVRTRDVDYFESAANYVRVHVGAEHHLIRDRMGDLAARLNPVEFARIHRSTIVNLDRIKEIEPWVSGDAIVTLRDGRRLRLSRQYRHAIDTGVRGRR